MKRPFSYETALVSGLVLLAFALITAKIFLDGRARPHIRVVAVSADDV